MTILLSEPPLFLILAVLPNVAPSCNWQVALPISRCATTSRLIRRYARRTGPEFADVSHSTEWMVHRRASTNLFGTFLCAIRSTLEIVTGFSMASTARPDRQIGSTAKLWNRFPKSHFFPGWPSLPMRYRQGTSRPVPRPLAQNCKS